MQMMPKLFVSIAIAAVLSLAAAVAVYMAGNRWVSGEVSGEPAFPALERKANDVASIEVIKGGKSLTISRDADGWVAKGAGGYPADGDKVRAAIVDLAQAELIEPKTRLPEKYELLDLDEPGKGSEARRFVLRDADGETIIEAILGKKRYGAFGTGKSGTYVRKPDNPQTWLTNLDVDETPDVTDWVDIKFFNVDIKDIRSVALEHSGEEPLTIRRKPGEEAAFEVSLPDEESQLKKDGPSAKSVVEAFANIELEDLRKLDSSPAGDDVSQARLETDDGLSVTFRYRKDKSDHWVSLTAQGSGDATAKAEKLNARVGGWEFKIPGWKADKLFKRRSDFIETS